MKRSPIKDERITAQVQSYGYQAFGILFVLLMVSVSIKLFILNLDMKYWIDTFLILIGACAYFTFRCIMGGVFVMSDKAGDKKRFRKVNLISGAIGAVVWGALMFLYDFYYEESFHFIKSLTGTFVGTVVFFLGTVGLQMLIFKLSNDIGDKKSN
jgi:hypothetical protein